MIKRFVALLMVLILCISAPVTAQASEIPEETQPVETIEEIYHEPISEAADDNGNNEALDNLQLFGAASTEYLRLISGCLVFIVVIILCYFVYKFFRIFF